MDEPTQELHLRTRVTATTATSATGALATAQKHAAAGPKGSSATVQHSRTPSREGAHASTRSDFSSPVLLRARQKHAGRGRMGQPLGHLLLGCRIAEVPEQLSHLGRVRNDCHASRRGCGAVLAAG
jgi:hypothetical protein